MNRIQPLKIDIYQSNCLIFFIIKIISDCSMFGLCRSEVTRILGHGYIKRAILMVIRDFRWFLLQVEV